MSDTDSAKDQEVQPEEQIPVTLADTPEEVKEPIAYKLLEKKSEPGCVARYIVEVERAEFDKAVDKSLAEVSKTVAIEGFRPGKAPIRLVRKRFGTDAEGDAIRDIAGNIAAQIRNADELKPLTDPELHHSDAAEGQPLKLEIDFDLPANVEPKNYTGLTVEVEAPVFSEEMVENQLKDLQNRAGRYGAPKDGPKEFAEGDAARVDVAVFDKSGKRIESQCNSNIMVTTRSHQLRPELASQLIGKKAGDTISADIRTTTRNRAGKEVVHESRHEVTINEVLTRIVPELDDEFAKDLGDFENMEALRTRVRQDIERNIQETRGNGAMQAILEKVLQETPLDPPRKVVAAREYQAIMEDTRQAARLGMDPDALIASGYLSRVHDNTLRSVQFSLLGSAIADKEKIEVTEEDLDKEFEKRAEESGRKPLAIRAHFEAEKQLDSLKNQLRMSKVQEFLLGANTVNYVEPKEKPAAQDETKADAGTE